MAHRFLNYFGEEYVRLSRDVATFYDVRDLPHSRWFRIISPLLFSSPASYFEEVAKAYTDRAVHYDSWRKFISGLKSEWESLVIPVRDAPHLCTSSQVTPSYYSLVIGNFVTLSECGLPGHTKCR